MVDIKQVETIRRRLKYTWRPFFSRFGRLTPIQIQTIPKILDGINVVVASPTASGKTEAVVAPVAERFASEKQEGLAVLYIVPTRALANDTLARIEGPLEDMYVKTALKHGDKPQLPRELPNFLITTPESLDSLICRHPEIFATLRTIILDEIHLLDNTYRGDQLRLLLKRLEQLIAHESFSTHLLSATLSEPAQIAQRYVSNFEVVNVPGQREIEYHFLASHQDVQRLARSRSWKKLLCFCNLRESVESVATELSQLWRPYPVVAHHGSLDRDVREEAEVVMKEANVAVCVSTSTLEIGIDIGNIDLVVLAEIPWSISAMLQRVGRGNRRHGKTHVAVVTTSEDEKQIMEAMFRAAASGALPVAPYVPDLSVAVQQIFSYLYQHPQGKLETELVEILSPISSTEEVGLILRHLQQKGWVEYRTGHWFASTKLMDKGEEGRIHSNIPDTQSYRVVDTDSGKVIGTIFGTFDETFVLGRRTWQILSVVGDIVKARQIKGQASAPIFQRHRNMSFFFYLLPPELKTGRENRG